ncbi:MAG: GIY-YIG nuclease family protein [Anaerolineae bacterium]|nr:GIY-YIG nuclease family protein [Anaerolineae bacterium]
MPILSAIPDQAGTYVLLIRIIDRLETHVGRLGVVQFAPGLYVYVGSAHGPGGLRARIGRHNRKDKTVHWHIDAVTAAAPVIEVWWYASPQRLECRWAKTFASNPAVTAPVPGFGASDCACQTHLFLVPGVEVRSIWEALGRPARVSFES